MYFLRFPSAALVLLLMAGCVGGSSYAPPDPSAITDRAYLTAPRWSDGKAEVAFYRVERSRNPDLSGEAENQSFLVGTYLVKHRFSPERMTKATEDADGAVSAFKYALFYELGSGSYQYNRHYVTNARQADLRPLKASFTSFDWCSNQYRELAFHPDGTVEYLMRSDDYGNAHRTFDYRIRAYPPAMLPLLMRGLDFSEKEEHTFFVVLPEGRYVEARARLAGRDTLDLPSGSTLAQRIAVTYEETAPSVIAGKADLKETYWRGTGPARRLLKLEGASGRYRMTLVESLRTAYWKENLWPQLERIGERP